MTKEIKCVPPGLFKQHSVLLSPFLCLYSKYQSENISTNLYVISQPWLYTLAWCAGAQSVTTNSIHILSNIDKPLFLMVSRSNSDRNEGPVIIVHSDWTGDWSVSVNMNIFIQGHKNIGI